MNSTITTATTMCASTVSNVENDKALQIIVAEGAALVLPNQSVLIGGRACDVATCNKFVCKMSKQPHGTECSAKAVRNRCPCTAKSTTKTLVFRSRRRLFSFLIAESHVAIVETETRAMWDGRR